MYELIIVGAGPAGITSAVYSARKRLNTLVVTKDIGGQAALSGEIENYTGYQFISGPELAQKFEEHLKKYDLELKENETVTEVKKEKEIIFVKTDKSIYEARTVIIASGKRPRLLNVPGEIEFKNRGVTYCATCDGPLFFGKTVAVIGGGNSALDAVLQLVKIAKTIYLVNITEKLTGDPIMQEKVQNYDKVRILNKTQVIEILGDKFVKGIRIKREGKEEELSVEGVFIEIGLVPNSEFISQVEKNELGEIKVNCRNETSLEAVFAAGDVTDVPEKQIIVACGEGAKASLSAFKYLSTHKF